MFYWPPRMWSCVEFYVLLTTKNVVLCRTFMGKRSSFLDFLNLKTWKVWILEFLILSQKFHFFKVKIMELYLNVLELLLFRNVHHSSVWDNLRVGVKENSSLHISIGKAGLQFLNNLLTQKFLFIQPNFRMTFFVTAQTAFHHCTFRFITAYFVHHCT